MNSITFRTFDTPYVVASTDQQGNLFSLLISTHKVLNISESTILFSASFIYTYYNVSLEVEVATYNVAYNIDIKLIAFEIYLIHKPAHLDSHKFRKIFLITLRNDP